MGRGPDSSSNLLNQKSDEQGPAAGDNIVSGGNGGRGKFLSSWKEIAAYLGKSVRTVQRMEVELGLPIRRPKGHPRTSVIAIPTELDAWLKSFSPSRGSAFTSPLPSHFNGRAPGPIRVLLVEDREVMLYAISRQLRGLGYEVTTTQSGKQALDLAGSNPDIVLLDLNLPEMHGLEVLRRLRTNLNTGHIPVICTSATYLPEGAAPVALQLGASRFLAHPIGPETLHRAIQEVLNTASMAERV